MTCDAIQLSFTVLPPPRTPTPAVGIPGPIRACCSLSPFGNPACWPHCRTLPTYIVVFTWHVRYPFAPIPTGAQMTPLLPLSHCWNSQHLHAAELSWHAACTLEVAHNAASVVLLQCTSESDCLANPRSMLS